MNRVQKALVVFVALLLMFPIHLSAGLIGLSSNYPVGPGSIYSIDSGTGLATKIADLQGAGISTSLVGFEVLNGVGYATDVFTTVDDLSGPYYGSIDLSTGAFSPLGVQRNSTGALDYNWHALAGDAIAGALYMASNGGEFYSIDPTTGTSTFKGFLTLDGTALTVFGMAGMAFDPVNGILYGVSSGASYSTLYTIDPGTAVATLLGYLDLGTGGMAGLAYDYENGLLFMNTGWDPNGYRLFQLDPATLSATLVGTNSAAAWTDGTGIDGLAFVGSSGVPEPATLTLFSAAFLSLLALRLRRGRQ